MNLSLMSRKKRFQTVNFYHLSFFRVGMCWKTGDNRNLFVKLKSKLRLYNVASTARKISLKKIKTCVVELQQLPDIETTKKQVFCPKWTTCNERKKRCVNFRTSTKKLNSFVCRYRNSLYLKDNGVEVKTTEHQTLLAQSVYPLSYIAIFYKLYIVLDDTTVDN